MLDVIILCSGQCDKKTSNNGCVSMLVVNSESIVLYPSTKPSKCLSLRVEESVTALVATGLFLLEAASPFLPSSCTFQSNERKDHLDVLLGIEF